MKNKLIVIGFLTIKRCYLNVPREEAIHRYMEMSERSLNEDDLDVYEVEFDEEFNSHEVWN